MKSEADPRQRLIFCVILENIMNLGRKVRNQKLVGIDDLFFRDYCISRKKSALPRTILSDDLFFLAITAFQGEKVH